MPVLDKHPYRPRSTPGWQLFHRYDVSVDEFQLHIRLVDHTGKRWAVAPLTFSEVGIPLPQSLASPTEDGSPDVSGFLQAALDVAWEIGLRPAGFDDHTNELKATRAHLADMRKLAKVPGA